MTSDREVAYKPEAAGDLLLACVPPALLIAAVLIGFFALCFYLGVGLLLAVPAGIAAALVMAKTAANRLRYRRERARSSETKGNL